MANRYFIKVHHHALREARKKIKSVRTRDLFTDLYLNFNINQPLPTNEIIANKIGQNPRTIATHMTELFKAGVLIKKGNVRSFSLDIVSQDNEIITNKIKYSDERTRKAHEDALERRSSQNDSIRT